MMEADLETLCEVPDYVQLRFADLVNRSNAAPF
jgi:hypothetical protein